jgi:hypothetical protein
MTMNDNRSRRTLVAALCLFVLACVSGVALDDQPRHGWWSGNGIVVPHDSFPSDCTLCHLEGSWNEMRADFSFDHAKQAGSALSGAHAKAKCLRCHNDRGPVQLFAQQGCAGCHEDVHRKSLGSQCTSCHGEDTWILSDEVAMHNRTRFPLVGAHAAAQCWTCHPGGEVGNWSRVDVECTTCHAGEAASAASPNHVANGWTAACDRCHIPTTWSGAGFNHFAFALTGAHAAADCAACHVGDVFTGLPTDCAGCHTDDYQQAIDPDHGLAGFPLTCELCHDTSGWDGALFSHASIASGCIVCHQADYDGAGDPNHLAKNFSTSCEECHGTRSWEGASFQHLGISSGCSDCHLDEYAATTAPDHGATGIPLTCEQCHVTSTWFGASFDHQGVSSGCSTCHLSEYSATTDPDHAALGIPMTCESCHSTRTWFGANFDHQGVGGSCVSCHQSDYDRTNTPNHLAAGVGTNCEACHGTNFWRPANMSHVGISSNCVVCHVADYNQASRPNHLVAGFPSNCEQCHTTNGWVPASFNHNFPIQGGDHGGLQCIDCHNRSSNFQVFSCIDCHEHTQGDMADEHDRVGGYTWSSNACYGCHPNGQQ